MRQYPAVLVLLTLTACGDHQPPAQEADHVWKIETDMIEKAQEVEGMISDISAQQRRQIDEQAQ